MKLILKSIKADWRNNPYNYKAKLILFLFRFSKVALLNKFYFFLMIPYLIFYRVFVEWFLGVEIPWKTQIGKGLILDHGVALVINDNCIIGENCTVRHCTTIGNKQMENGLYSKCPRIGNNVDIGSNVIIIGPVVIGDNVKIGAGSVVVRDVPSCSTVVGNPARVINK